MQSRLSTMGAWGFAMHSRWVKQGSGAVATIVAADVGDDPLSRDNLDSGNGDGRSRPGQYSQREIKRSAAQFRY